PLLHEARERRPHDRPVDALFVHELQAGTRLAERGDGVHPPAHQLAPALALGVAPAEVLLLGTRADDAVEGRVRDVLADAAVHRDLRPAGDLDVTDQAVVALRQVAGEGVAGLVEVVVGVEHLEIELAARHGSPRTSSGVPRGGPREMTSMLDHHTLRPTDVEGSRQSRRPHRPEGARWSWS